MIGLFGLLLNLHLCSVEKALFNTSVFPTSNCSTSKTPESTGLLAKENPATCNQVANDQQGSAAVMPADLGITSVIAPIISQYLAEFLPRLVL